MNELSWFFDSRQKIETFLKNWFKNSQEFLQFISNFLSAFCAFSDEKKINYFFLKLIEMKEFFLKTFLKNKRRISTEIWKNSKELVQNLFQNFEFAQESFEKNSSKKILEQKRFKNEWTQIEVKSSQI